MQMMPNKADFKATISQVPVRTWQILGGLIVFGVLMRLATVKRD
ncbi:hypothetical protein [Lacticaseibacillus daqingensis]|nr:hypothetical protein [Lacticaseibacillus daqingensis]